jgi:F0F1-type ATP synthase membrane subunit b/b'
MCFRERDEVRRVLKCDVEEKLREVKRQVDAAQAQAARAQEEKEGIEREHERLREERNELESRRQGDGVSGKREESVSGRE